MADLTTLAKVKRHIFGANPVADDDDILERLISEASTEFERRTDRQIASSSIVETFNGSGLTQKVLREYPVTAVSSVTVNGETIPARPSVTEDGWILDESTIRLVGYYFTEGTANCVVTYTAGYTTVPADVEGAVIQLVALRFSERDRIGQMSRSSADGTVAFQTTSLPYAIRAVIDDWKRVLGP